MKKTLWSVIAVTQLLTQLHAGGDIDPVDMDEPEVMEVEVAESNFYVVAKGLAIFGDTVNHGNAVLDGDQDFGAGIDFGYRLGSGFAVEYDFSYASNKVNETVGGVSTEVDAKYYTSALDIVYTYELTEELGIFGKVGYEYEWEKIDDLNIDSTDNGFVFGAGMEVSMTESHKFILEYEHSTIDGPRGDSLYAGVMFNF